MTSEARILIVEDEAAQRRLIGDILRREGFAVTDVGAAEAALEQLEASTPDLILCDWRLPGMGGGGLLEEVRRRALPCAFVVMTAYGSIAHAVEAIRMGADDYLAKPFEREALLIAVRRVLKTRRLEQENRRLREEVDGQARFGELVGHAPSMQRLYRTVQRVAATDATVLIHGESGTGKELVARTLHARSQRAAGPFVAVNCAAIPESLIESELFGHEKGAFTGAHRKRAGKFEEAHGGTLFLDEVPSMPLPLQATLLRVLQERRFTPLGARGEVSCDVRVIAASNRDLAKMVAEGTFREDLYYRLNVLPIVLPPLRERAEDVPLLAAAFLERAAERYGVKMEPLPAVVQRRLMAYRWPGNVRELANLVERMVLLADDGAVRLEDLPPELEPPAAEGCPFRLPAEGLQWDAMEAGLLRQALERADGNCTAAARLVGLSYKTFLYRLEKYGLA